MAKGNPFRLKYMEIKKLSKIGNHVLLVIIIVQILLLFVYLNKNLNDTKFEDKLSLAYEDLEWNLIKHKSNCNNYLIKQIVDRKDVFIVYWECKFNDVVAYVTYVTNEDLIGITADTFEDNI